MDHPCFVIVRSLNREAPYFQGAQEVGLSVLAFDARTGTAQEVCHDGSIDSPTYLSVDADTHCVDANTKLQPASGFWHLAFHPGRRHALVICQLDSTVAALSYAPATGHFALESTVATVPDAARGANQTGQLARHADPARAH